MTDIVHRLSAMSLLICIEAADEITALRTRLASTGSEPPRDEDLPTLKSLIGAVPDLTGGLSTEEYLDRIRSEPTGEAREAVALIFTERPDAIRGTELFAPIPLLEHTVGAAGFSIRPEIWGSGYKVTFWHGNRGHAIAQYASTEPAARAAAQEHLDNLVAALLREPQEKDHE